MKQAPGHTMAADAATFAFPRPFAMSLATIELHPDTEPVATVIVLHGLGADGTDFLPMCEELDLSAIGPVRYVMPRAPVRRNTCSNTMAPGSRISARAASMPGRRSRWARGMCSSSRVAALSPASEST